jgi:hypothetical protein
MAGKKEIVPLTEKEKDLIRKLFIGRGFGELRFSPPPEILADPDFIKLREKLNLRFLGE